MSNKPRSKKLSAEEVKASASGRWLEILASVAGIPSELLDGKGHPCPKCGGTDRFSLIDETAGAVLCRKCFSKQNGDGLAAVAWMHDCEFPKALNMVAYFLGLTAEKFIPPNTSSRSHNSQNSSSAPSDKNIGNNGSAQSRIVDAYDYCDEAYNLLFQSVRFVPKDFKQRRPDGKGGWVWNVKGVRVVPYRLPELLASPNQPVVVVEGEKDANNVARLGLLATCNAGGAGKWTAEHAEFLRGRCVIVLPDNDEAGRNHAQQVAQSLYGIARWVHVIELPGLPPKGDVSDWIAAGGSIEELKRLSRATPDWTPSAVPQPWPEIDSFDVLDLPEFPTHVLPPVLRRWVEAESHATQTPADLPALLGLAVCSATIARLVEVEPRAGWREPINIYTAVLLPPANRKSPVFADATRPLREIESEMIENARPSVARAQSQRRQTVRRLQKCERTAAEKYCQKSQNEAFSLAAELAQQDEPVLPRMIVDDVTNEKLEMILAQQGGRIASMSPEGGVFDLMAGQYSKSGMPTFGVYLMGHSGDDRLADRVTRDSVNVKRPAITCAYAMQPQVIAGLAGKVAFRGRGLLGRFLYSMARSWIGQRKIAPEPVPTDVAESYRQMVRALFQSCENREIAPDEPIVLQLTHDAQELLKHWEAEVESMLAEGGDMELVTDWGGKLAGATVRLAAIMHCAEFGPIRPIDSQAIAAAIEIGRYLIPHAEAALSLMEAKEGESVDDDAAYILRWIKRHQRREFTKTEAQHHGKRRFRKADAIDKPLEELVKRGYIRKKPSIPAGPGRPPSPAYEVNSAVFSDSESEKRSHNSRNSSESNDSGNSGNNRSASSQPESTDREQVTI